MVLTHRFLIVATREGKLEWLHTFIPKTEADPRMHRGKPSPNLTLARVMSITDSIDED